MPELMQKIPIRILQYIHGWLLLYCLSKLADMYTNQ